MGHFYVYGFPHRQEFKLGFASKRPLDRGNQYRRDSGREGVDFLGSVFATGTNEADTIDFFRGIDGCWIPQRGHEVFDARNGAVRGFVRWLFHRSFTNHNEKLHADLLPRVHFDDWGPSADRIEPVHPPGVIDDSQMILGDVDAALGQAGPWDDIHRAPPITENDWYTPRPIIDRARRVMGSIDTDPATHQEGNRYICADTCYTIHNSGLTQNNPWPGNVWCNPPFKPGSLVKEFLDKALFEYFVTKNAKQIMFLVGMRKVSAKYFSEMKASCPVFWDSHGRVSFEGRKAMESAGNSSGDGTRIFYLGPNVDRFVRVFSEIGQVSFPSRHASPTPIGRGQFTGNDAWNREYRMGDDD